MGYYPIIIMKKRNENNIKKECFLRKVLDLKNELFGAFSINITKETRRQAWIKLRDYAVSMALISSEKDFTYIRDATWPNIRNRTLKKLDSVSKNVTGGGSDIKLDSIDHLVLEIIGRESPVFQGCGVADSMGETSQITLSVDSPQSCVELNLECDMVEEQHEVMQDRVAVKRKLTVTREEDELNEIEALKKRKLELEIRRLELEVWEKENALHVKHSYLTNDIEEIGDGQ
ncbi:uncharacterized protein [Periplaneta americana]|uniref:uncharacterized protein isoform X2 n=1 Tax=Periplaneta americana TaxID=6978 RepID=UPI0037E7B83D